MKVRIDFGPIEPLYLTLTPVQIEALEDEYDWLPFIDVLGEELENYILSRFTIESVTEVNY